ncbi:hypothetical protein PROFUN_13947 [Planoprotostelium fungivorum]|uniref:Uncharacterized protein n=1 Tax=Planoprotostelium fungivorum TaxID=1890364 RepID=A0A2P6N2G5_9EUKA|nr:hypothetical protein PROFUN_13947 [Planoprotostelium fungivorum]
MEFGYNNIPPSQWKDWDLDGLDVGVASFNLILIPVLFVIFRRWEYKNGGVFRPVFYGLTAARIAHLISQILLREGVLIVPWWFYWFIATLPMMLFFTLFSTTLCSWGRVFISAEQQHSQRHSLSNRLTKVSRIMETVAYVVYFALTVLNLGLSVDQVTESSGDGEDYKPPIAAARSGTEKGILAFFVVLYVGVPLSFVIYMERFFMYSKLYKVNVFNKAYMTERSKPVVRRLSVVNLTLMFLFIMRAVILITNESSTNIRTTQWQGRLPFSIIFTLFLEILPTCLLLATATKRKSTKAQNKPLANAGRTSSFTSTIADLIRSEPSTPYMSSPVMVARSPKSYPSNSFASGITSTPPTRSPSSMGTVFSETSNLLPTRSIADLQNANDVNSIQRLSQYASINQCFHVERRSLFSAWIQYGAVKVVAISERVWTEPQQFHPRWEQEALLLLIRSYINSTQGQLWSDMANSHALEARRRPAHLPAVKNAPIPTVNANPVTRMSSRSVSVSVGGRTSMTTSAPDRVQVKTTLPLITLTSSPPPQLPTTSTSAPPSPNRSPSFNKTPQSPFAQRQVRQDQQRISRLMDRTQVPTVVTTYPKYDKNSTSVPDNLLYRNMIRNPNVYESEFIALSQERTLDVSNKPKPAKQYWNTDVLPALVKAAEEKEGKT